VNKSAALAAQPAAKAMPPRQGVLQRKCDCGNHTAAGGECEECRKKKTTLQRLAITPARDAFEDEADRIAERVLATPSHAVARRAPPRIQRYTEGNAGSALTAPRSVDRVLAGPSQPMDAAVRFDMEQRFGHDFSLVRVHSGAAAAQSARDVSAHAYTVGNHIVFGEGTYAPSTLGGRRLIAHELTHVVQQSGNVAREPIDRVGSGSITRATSDTLRRQSTRSDTATRPRGSTLPYVEANNLFECARIMGSENLEFCRRQVLGEKVADAPLAVRAQRIARDLTDLIAGATWKEIRKRAYPRESAAGVKRAKDRKAGTAPDLTGLGKIGSLEHVAVAIRGVQRDWKTLTPDDRVKKLGDAATAEMKAADVPEFLAVRKQPMEFKGFFTPGLWTFTISEEAVTNASLNEEDAAELANTTMHESRHAEQRFLAARFAAGVQGKNAAAVEAELKIPGTIAQKAVRKKFNATTDPKVKSLGQAMFSAEVTQGTTNQTISDDDGLRELANRKADAEAARSALTAAVTSGTYSAGVAARDALRAQIVDVERRYKLYRNIPYEADAHEVGDAAEQAFLGWR